MRGKFSKWTRATIDEELWLGKVGIKFEVWTKYKKQRKKLGTVRVTVAGLRWLPHMGKREIRRSWDQVAGWFEGSP
jgi:hypothetical protein